LQAGEQRGDAMWLNVDVFGEVQFSRELLRIVDRTTDMRPAWQAVHRSFLGAERRQFATEGGTYSGGWAPLKPTTVASKIAAGLDPRVLHATLRLRRSLTSELSADHVFRMSFDEMFVGSSVPYGVHHQFGTKFMQRRRPVEFNDALRKRWVKIMQSWIMKAEVDDALLRT